MKKYLFSELLADSRSGFWGLEPGESEIDVRVVRNGDIQVDGVHWHTLPIRSVSISEAERSILRKGDILITTSGECGYSAHIESEPEERTIASNFVRILRFDNTKVIPRFAFHFVHSKDFLRKLAPHIRGTTLKNLSFATAIKHIEFGLPSLAKQLRIADILDKVGTLTVKRMEALKQLDCLRKSIFMDMFGDPASNPKGWTVVQLGEVIEDLTDYHANGSYEILRNHVALLDTPDFALMLRTTDLESNNYIDGVKYISESAYNFLKKSKVFGGEIIINKIGSAGKVYLAPNFNRPVSLGMNSFLLRISKVANAQYIYHVLTTKYIEGITAVQNVFLTGLPYSKINQLYLKQGQFENCAYHRKYAVQNNCWCRQVCQTG